MWYVIQTMVGHEKSIVEKINSMVDKSTFNSCFTLISENMRRKEGIQHIYKEVLFSGYVFVDTYTPTKFYEELKAIVGFTKLLAENERVDDDAFLPIRVEEQLFLESIIDEEFTVRLSLVKRNKDNRVIALDGALLSHENEICGMDYQHRRAFIITEIMGQERRVKLGICTKEDLLENGLSDKLMDLENKLSKTKGHEKLQTNPKSNPYEGIDKWDWQSRKKIDEAYRKDEINDAVVSLKGIEAGMYVRIKSGIYGDNEFLVKSLNMNKRTIKVEMKLFGSLAEVEVGVDEVE